jgi:predicted outer membrane repeat protein
MNLLNRFSFSAGIIPLALSFSLFILPLRAQVNRYVSITGNNFGGASTCFDPNAPCRTIVHALGVSANGDTINIAGGAYTENIIINKSIVLKGVGQGVTILQAHAQYGMWGGRVLTISSATDVRIADLTIRHGGVNGPTGYEVGAGIFNDGSNLNLTNVTLFGNIALIYGGGIYHTNGSLTLTNVRFIENAANSGGGLFSVTDESVSLYEVTFNDNTATQGGGLFVKDGSPVLTNVTFTGNNNSDGNSVGGGMFIFESSPTLTHVTFEGNSSGSGGAIFTSKSTVTMNNVSFIENNATKNMQINSGGGIYNSNGSLHLTGVSFIRNSSIQPGGGISNMNGSSVILNDVSFIENTSDMYGGGIYNEGNNNVTLLNVLLQRNKAEDGGGIYSTGNTTLLLNDVTFDENIADVDGGGMYNAIIESASLNNVVFTGNTSGNNGGGMFNVDSFPILKNVTFSGNSAVIEGGGMYNFSGTPKLTNVSFNGNSADNGGGIFNQGSSPHIINGVFNNNMAGNGGAVYNKNNSHPPLTNLTLAGNRAALEGGGIYNKESSPALTNVIIWNNKQENSTSSVSASIHNDELSQPDISYSLIANSGGSGAGWNAALGIDGGNNIGLDPRFIADADPDSAPVISGDLRLQSDSPAVDSGDPNILLSLFPLNEENIPIDLDGNPRLNNERIDMGAYEHHDPSTFVEDTAPLPSTIELLQNYPNPFNPSTIITYSLPERTHIDLAVFDMLGRKVKVLVEGEQAAGRYEAYFDAGDLSSGIYLYRLYTGSEVRSGKMMLLR